MSGTALVLFFHLSSLLMSERSADATDILRCERHKYIHLQAWRHFAPCRVQPGRSRKPSRHWVHAGHLQGCTAESYSYHTCLVSPSLPPSLPLFSLASSSWDTRLVETGRGRSGRGEVRDRYGPRARGHTDLHISSPIALHYRTEGSAGVGVVVGSCMTRSQVKANLRFLTRCDAVTFRDLFVESYNP